MQIKMKRKNTKYIFFVVLYFTNYSTCLRVSALLVFSLPELKAEVSISDRLSSVVCLSVCPSIRSFVCKLYLF